MDRLRAIAVMTSVLMTLSGCTPGRLIDSGLAREHSDIHERLSAEISRDGFDYTLLSQSEGVEHIAVISIQVSLDSLKSRHLSLEKLMTDIGRICSHPDYSHLPVRILIGAGDEDDQMYLYAILATAVKGRSNIALVTVADPRNEIIIKVRHPGRGGS